MAEDVYTQIRGHIIALAQKRGEGPIDADVVFGVWPDPGKEDGFGIIIVRGSRRWNTVLDGYGKTRAGAIPLRPEGIELSLQAILCEGRKAAHALRRQLGEPGAGCKAPSRGLADIWRAREARKEDDPQDLSDFILAHIYQGRVAPDLSAASPDELLAAVETACVVWGRTLFELGEYQTGERLPQEPPTPKPTLRARRDRAFELRLELEARLMPLLVGVAPLQ